MTDLELKELVASVAVAQKEGEIRLRETEKLLTKKFLETEKLLTDKHLETEKLLTDKHLETEKLLTDKHLETEKLLTDKHLETEKLLTDKHLETDKALNITFQETNRLIVENGINWDKRLQETRKIINDISKNLGGIGNSLGDIAEGLTYASIDAELRKKFHAEFVSKDVKKKKDGVQLELDIFAYSNTIRNEVFIVEIKATLRKDTIEQLKKSLQKFRLLFPEHKDKKLYGIICALKAQDKEIQEIYENGFYFAQVQDGLFTILKPENFKPHEF